VASTTELSAAPEDGYPGAVIAVAVLTTLFLPLVSLIAGLVLMGGERPARKREQLRNWAWASAGWIVGQIVLFLLLAAVVLTRST